MPPWDGTVCKKVFEIAIVFGFHKHQCKPVSVAAARGRGLAPIQDDQSQWHTDTTGTHEHSALDTDIDRQLHRYAARDSQALRCGSMHADGHRLTECAHTMQDAACARRASSAGSLVFVPRAWGKGGARALARTCD